jgi:hypothetical protein
VCRDTDLLWFWARAVQRMRRLGLSAGQRQRLLSELVRKGAPKPSPQLCERFGHGWPFMADFAREVSSNVAGAAA